MPMHLLTHKGLDEEAVSESLPQRSHHHRHFRRVFAHALPVAKTKGTLEGIS
jgi:hypothetical protein